MTNPTHTLHGDPILQRLSMCYASSCSETSQTALTTLKRLKTQLITLQNSNNSEKILEVLHTFSCTYPEVVNTAKSRQSMHLGTSMPPILDRTDVTGQTNKFLVIRNVTLMGLLTGLLVYPTMLEQKKIVNILVWLIILGPVFLNYRKTARVSDYWHTVDKRKIENLHKDLEKTCNQLLQVLNEGTREYKILQNMLSADYDCGITQSLKP